MRHRGSLLAPYAIVRTLGAASIGVLAVLAPVACDYRSTGDMAPVAVALDDADPDLAARLSDLVGAARAAPQSGELRGRLAMAYEVNGFPDAALATYVQAAILDPEEFSWPYFHGLLLAKSGDLAGALESLEGSLAIDDQYVPAWLWRGKWSLDLGDYDAAETAYRRAEALDAGTPAIAGLAQVSLRRGLAAEAVALLEPVSAAQRHPHLYRMLGEAYRRLGREEDARLALARGRAAVHIQWFDPRQNVKAEYIAGFKNQMAHAQNLLAAEKYDDALEILEPWMEHYANDEALMTNLGWAYMSSGDLDRAYEILKRGLAEHATDTAGYYFHYHIGRLYNMRGEVDEALQHFHTASELNPTQSHPHEERGKILLRQGQRDEALAAFDLALESGARSPEKLLQTIGIVEAASGHWDEAAARFLQAVEIDPSFTMAHVQLGRTLAQTGRWTEAGDALARADRLGTHPRDVAAARQVLADLKAASEESVAAPVSDSR